MGGSVVELGGGARQAGRAPWLRPVVALSAFVLLGWVLLAPAGADPASIDGLLRQDWSLPVAALAAIALLSADVVLPVPSTIVLLAVGARFGVAGGSVVAVVGLVTATLVGFAMGRGMATVGQIRRALRPDTGAGVAVGPWWIAATRGVPVLSEATAIAAGATGTPARPVVIGAVAGSIPVGVVYALAGDRIGESDLVGFVVAAIVLTVHGGVVLVRHRRRATTTVAT